MAFDKESFLETFARNVRIGRAALDLTQVELAERVGCSTSAIFQYEDGGYLPSAERVWALCDALGTTPNELMGYPGGGEAA